MGVCASHCLTWRRESPSPGEISSNLDDMFAVLYLLYLDRGYAANVFFRLSMIGAS